MTNQKESLSIIKHVQKQALLKCRQIERFPEFQGGTLEEVRQQRYPVERQFAGYKQKLADLELCLNNLPPSSRILDIGAGLGFALAEIEERYRFNVIGTGILDIEPQCPFIESVAADLPFATNSFDLVISMHGISWEPNQKRALAEVKRVLKPNSMALIYLITFANSIYIWHGESFWQEIGVSLADYRPYQFSREEYLDKPGTRLTIIDRKPELPDEYRYAYYLMICNE